MVVSVRGEEYGYAMELNMVEMIGILAGCCTTASFVPQVLHSWRTKSVKDISLRMYLLLSSGILLWLVYGFNIGSLSVVLANSVTFVLVVSILIMKVRYSKLSSRNTDRTP